MAEEGTEFFFLRKGGGRRWRRGKAKRVRKKKMNKKRKSYDLPSITVLICRTRPVLGARVAEASSLGDMDAASGFETPEPWGRFLGSQEQGTGDGDTTTGAYGLNRGGGVGGGRACRGRFQVFVYMDTGRVL